MKAHARPSLAWTLPLSMAALTVAFAASPSARAAPRAQIVSVTLSGTGCSEANAQSALAPDGDFELRFTDLFAAAAHPEPDAAASCDVEVLVRPPHGYALAINGARLEGAARATGGGVARVTQSYAIERAGGGFSNNEDTWESSVGGYDGDAVRAFTQAFGPGFSSPADIPADWMGGCGTPTRVRGSLSLDASSGGSGAAEIYADRALLGGGGHLEWDWELVPCRPDDGGDHGGGDGSLPPDALDGAWAFTYESADGRPVSGRMILAGAAGSYRANGAAWSGKISQLRSEGGSVKGRWEALGRAGWVSFTPVDGGRAFRGSWGETGAGASGSWNGRKE